MSTRRKFRKHAQRAVHSPLWVPFILVSLLTGCSRTLVEVSEVINDSQCQGAQPGVKRSTLADLANLRGRRLLGGAASAEPSSYNATFDAVLLTVSNGPQPSAGYTLNLADAKARNGELRLDYQWTTPPADQLSAQLMTHPCSVVTVRTENKPLRVSVWLNDEFLSDLILTE